MENDQKERENEKWEQNLTLGRIRKFIPSPWYRGVDGTLPRSFGYVAVFSYLVKVTMLP